MFIYIYQANTVYYFNTKTNEARWDRPTDFTTMAVEDPQIKVRMSTKTTSRSEQRAVERCVVNGLTGA